jgi:hypothetical protein
MDGMRFGLLAAAGWLAAAAVTVAVSWSAVSVVRDAVSPTTIVAAGLPSASGTTAFGAARTPAPSRSSGPVTGEPVSGGGQGGIATVLCVAGVPRFVNVTPAQGYRTRTDDSPGKVEFDSSTHRTEVTASCTGSTAAVAVEEKETGGGSGSGGGSSGSSGGGSGSPGGTVSGGLSGSRSGG